MPLYDYKCGEGHLTTEFRSYENRKRGPKCKRCGAKTQYQFPMSHVEPDGIYSYAPNIGTEADFERRREAIKEGQKVIKRGGP